MFYILIIILLSSNNIESSSSQSIEAGRRVDGVHKTPEALLLLVNPESYAMA